MTVDADGSLGGRRVVVTGGTGFIGRVLVDALEAGGADVHVLSRRPLARPGFHQVDLGDAGAVVETVARLRPEVVFHLGGLVTGARSLDAVGPTLSANTVGTVNLLTAAARVGVRRVVVSGSMEEPVLGSADPPGHPYAASKAAATLYATMFASLFDLPVVVLRIFLTYGPGSERHDAQLVPYVARTLLAGRPPSVTSGERRVDLVYVDDVVRALLAAASRGEAGAIVDVGSGELHTVREVVELIASCVGAGAPAPQFGALPDRRNEHARTADLSQARETLGWEPSVALQEGLRRTVEWLRRADA